VLHGLYPNDEAASDHQGRDTADEGALCGRCDGPGSDAAQKVLVARVVGQMKSPLYMLVTVLNGNLQG